MPVSFDAALKVSLEFREFLSTLSSGQRLSQCSSNVGCWCSREQSFRSLRGLFQHVHNCFGWKIAGLLGVVQLVV